LKSPVLRFFSKADTALREIPRMPYGVFNKKFPLPIARLMNKLVFAFLFICPNRLLIITPSRFRYLLLMASHSLGLKDNKVEALLKLDFPEVSADLIRSFSSARDYYLHGEIPNFDERLESVRNASFQIQNQTFYDIFKWSFWTLNHRDFHEVNTKVKSFLVSLPKTGEEYRRRYLPQHITNMGHLAMLFLYINYYRKSDPSRIIVLPKVKSANDYYLNLILRNSPLRIEFAEPEVFSGLPPTLVDTLHYSLDVSGKYRTESDCAFYSRQEHPEFVISEDFKLSLSEDEQQKGQSILFEHLGFQPLWYVILHIREPKNRDLKFAQARDANINSYHKVAQEVANQGGFVIRMGDKNLPKLGKNFPAWDYSHSEVKSEFMDVWLWANAKLWVGSVNGAAFPPITFGKKRILLNQWYWYNAGPSGDLAIRKQVVSSDSNFGIMNLEESKISRCMDRAFISRSGIKIHEATSDELFHFFVLAKNNQHTEYISYMDPRANLTKTFP